MNETPYFVEDNLHYVPTEYCNGFWKRGSLNGRMICGLMAHALDGRFGSPDFVPVRFTIDMLRLAPCTPLRIETEVVRSGKRSIFGRALLWSGDSILAQASAVYVRKTENPEIPTFQSPNWSVAPPEEIKSRPNQQHFELRPIPKAARTNDPDANTNALSTKSREHPEGRRHWLRDLRQVVGGIENSAFVSVAMLADFASPLTNSNSTALDFINTDLTMYLYRLPESEWIGLEFMKHNSSQGVAIGECWIYDEIGPLGTITVAAIANRPMN